MQQCNALLTNGKRCFRIAVIGETLCESHLGNPSPAPVFRFAQYSISKNRNGLQSGSGSKAVKKVGKVRNWNGFSTSAFAKRTVQPYEYHEYVNSDEWRQKSDERRKGERCSLCNRRSKIMHAHHRTYVRCGQENFYDLTVLCDDCHNLFHKNYDYDNRSDCFTPRQSAQQSVQRTEGGQRRKARKGKSKSKRLAADVFPQCEKCGSSFLWSNNGSAVCANPECGNRR